MKKSPQITSQAMIGLLLILFGGLFRASCHRHLGKMFTWDTSILKDHKLVTTGPYSIVRHPSYLGFLVCSCGYVVFLLSPRTLGRECLFGSSGSSSPLAVRSILGIIYLICHAGFITENSIFLVRRSYIEDGMMKGEFGKQWDDWAKNVRWRIFPYIF